MFEDFDRYFAVTLRLINNDGSWGNQTIEAPVPCVKSAKNAIDMANRRAFGTHYWAISAKEISKEEYQKMVQELEEKYKS